MLPPSVALEPGMLLPNELREASGFEPGPELPEAAYAAAVPNVKAATAAVMMNRLINCSSWWRWYRNGFCGPPIG